MAHVTDDGVVVKAAQFPEDVTEVRLAVHLGATLIVGDSNWAKPSVTCDLKFDGLPDEEAAKKAWDWLWDTQVGPQADELFADIKKAVAEIPRVQRPSGMPIRKAVEVPPGDAYD